jgi:cytochrome c556
MKRLAYPLGGLTLLAVLAVGPVGAQGGKTPPSVKEIMKRLHQGSGAPNVIIRMELQDEQPDWAAVQRLSMDFVTLGAALGKNNPPKGDRQSWGKVSAQYLEAAQAMNAAAQKKDKPAALAAHTRLNQVCKTCHDAHRPN